MAAYAALVSVMNIIETIQNHPRPPISFDNEQLQSLTEIITFLQEFLETHSVDDDGFEGRIADAAYAAEDVIESHIVDQIEASDHGETISSAGFYDGLHKVIQDLGLIKRDTMTFAMKKGMKDDDDNDDPLVHNNQSLRSSHSSTDAAVGFDDVLVEVIDKITGHRSNRHIIPIVGMGGIGKTTLASHIYVNPLVVHYFDLRGWATISREYNSKEILLEVLLSLNTMGSRESLGKMSEDKLGEKLYKSLCGRRYLIVLDDIWNIEVWDKVKTFLPDSNNGSAIMLTTRLLDLSFQLSSTCYEMSFLDEDKSWKLFCKSVFGEESCPPELKGIGKKIVENCKGLPLSIVVVGGLLAKSKQTRKYWLYIAGNLNSVVNLLDDERCMKILHLSYEELTVHLKPCFLYMGVFREDSVIEVPKLIRLWVAEGFLKPISGKCLEVVAREYFNNLVSRNLILVHKREWSGETIRCKVHDLLLDVCIREAQKHKFLYVPKHYNFRDSHDLYTHRRIVVHDDIMHLTILFQFHYPIVRSVTSTFLDSFDARLLRVWNLSRDLRVLKNTLNCRYISGLSVLSPNPSIFKSILISGVSIPLPNPSIFKSFLSLFRPSSNPNPLSSICLLWNLQTLYVKNGRDEVATSEIWMMSQIRHVYFDRLNLLDPPNDEGDDTVLGNLQTLLGVINFKFSEDVVKRIPNIKKLGVFYEGIVDWSSCCLNNLVQLNLESLSQLLT